MSDEQRPDEVADVEGHKLAYRDEGLPADQDTGEGRLNYRSGQDEDDDGPDVEGHKLHY
jgi:hypothetical protein